MRRSTVLVLAASSGAALITAVGPAAAVTPNDDSPVASDSYSLSIAVATESIDPGGSDTVSGILTQGGVPQSGDVVSLRARTGQRHHHRTHQVATATTDSDGSVSFPVSPNNTTHYRLVFRASSATPTASPSPVPSPASPGFVGARSKVATVHVVRETSLSIRAREARRGEVVQGQLRGGGHALPGRKVTLQERAVGSDTWSPVATHRTRRHGVVVFRITAPPAPEEFQLVFAGGPNFHGSQSGVVTIG